MMREKDEVIKELKFIGSPLDNKRDYKYIFLNRKKIEQELGDNLVMEQNGSVDIKYKQEEV